MSDECATASLPELAGSKEAREIFAVDAMTIHRWRQPGSGSNGPAGTFLPTPVLIAASPVWAASDLRRLKAELDAAPPRNGRGRAKA